MITLTPMTFLIVCAGVFLAGIVDSIGGGGGLISLPAFLIAGIPAHVAIATNKMSSTCGTALATWRFIQHRLVIWKLVLPAVLCSISGSVIGSNLSLLVSEHILKITLLFILPAVAFIVLDRHIFKDYAKEDLQITRKTYLITMTASFLIGLYDGFYGPGTGTFLIIAFTIFAHMSITASNAEAKVLNLSSNVTSLAVFLLHGQVILPLGLAAACFNMAGNYIGSGLVMNKGAKIVRPIIIAVLILLGIRILSEGL